MEEIEISRRLREIPRSVIIDAIKKCYIHVDLRLQNKTLSGAHCEQRLGMPAHDYYVGNAIKALYELRWEWKYEQYDISTQLIRIIDSMISAEVRKFKSERKRNIQLPLLVENDELAYEINANEEDYDPIEEAYHNQCAQALHSSCEDKTEYQHFLKLKLAGKNCNEISEIMGITVDAVYQMMETIARRAKKILKTTKI